MTYPSTGLEPSSFALSPRGGGPETWARRLDFEGRVYTFPADGPPSDLNHIFHNSAAGVSIARFVEAFNALDKDQRYLFRQATYFPSKEAVMMEISSVGGKGSICVSSPLNEGNFSWTPDHRLEEQSQPLVSSGIIKVQKLIPSLPVLGIKPLGSESPPRTRSLWGEFVASKDTLGGFVNEFNDYFESVRRQILGFTTLPLPEREDTERWGASSCLFNQRYITVNQEDWTLSLTEEALAEGKEACTAEQMGPGFRTPRYGRLSGFSRKV